VLRLNIWKLAGPAVFAAIIGSVALPATSFAQQKTYKACEDEWKADKTANQTKGITQKEYVLKCRTPVDAAKPVAATPAAATPAVAPKATTPVAAAATKTVKACEDEWKANKAANQAKKITEKDYVAKCRTEAGTTVTPAAAPTPVAAAPAPAPAATPAAAPAAPKTTAPPTAAPTAATVPTGARQYATDTQAKGQCPADTVVWANLDSKIFHFVGHKDYGHTKKGAYMCEKDALAQNIRAAKDEKPP
jgi:hypothetical protein